MFSVIGASFWKFVAIQQAIGMRLSFATLIDLAPSCAGVDLAHAPAQEGDAVGRAGRRGVEAEEDVLLHQIALVEDREGARRRRGGGRDLHDDLVRAVVAAAADREGRLFGGFEGGGTDG